MVKTRQKQVQGSYRKTNLLSEPGLQALKVLTGPDSGGGGDSSSVVPQQVGSNVNSVIRQSVVRFSGKACGPVQRDEEQSAVSSCWLFLQNVGLSCRMMSVCTTP